MMMSNELSLSKANISSESSKINNNNNNNNSNGNSDIKRQPIIGGNCGGVVCEQQSGSVNQENFNKQQKQQQQGHKCSLSGSGCGCRLEDSRSTYCSSVNADFANCDDSSFSSATNNCSDQSQATSAANMLRQNSKDSTTANIVNNNNMSTSTKQPTRPERRWRASTGGPTTNLTGNAGLNKLANDCNRSPSCNLTSISTSNCNPSSNLITSSGSGIRGLQESRGGGGGGGGGCGSGLGKKLEKQYHHQHQFDSSEPQSTESLQIDHNSYSFNKNEKARENWDKNIEFLLAVIGFAVDLGNVWRFPYICYQNGGGAFLIPYTIMFILGGLPIFYLEMSLGQFFSSGCLTVWRKVCPMAKGIGYAMCVLNFFTGLYYNTIISWAVFFFVQSFTKILPWTSCDNSWNSKQCKTIAQRQLLMQNSTYLSSNQDSIIISNFSRPTEDYFEREVLQIHLSTGIDDLGSIRKPLAIYLAIVFICIYFAIWKGVKSTGKAVWITALLPYFVLIPLLIRGIFLEGAWLGIKYYVYPEWGKILNLDVWVEAAKQIYFSLGPGFGTLMALSSYNKFNHNCHRDALIAAAVNYFASFISGLVIFAVLGYMATIENVPISSVVTEGPGLVFQVYPEGLATMRFSPMWSVLFFIMVITLGIDSTFGGLESVITGLCDEYPRLLRAHRGTFIGLLIILIYLCSLPTITYGGNYVIYVLESYGTLSLLFIVLMETIIVCWLYGADKFSRNLEEMHGHLPGLYWRVCWKYISPTILVIIFCAALSQELDKYHVLSFKNYVYPIWAPTLGLLVTGSSVCCIPIYAIYHLKTKTTGTLLERIKMGCTSLKTSENNIFVGVEKDKITDDSQFQANTVI